MRVYILRSQKTGRYYCGQTDDLSNRHSLHNGGRNKSTQHGIPWDLVWSLEVSTRSEAVKLESRIKSRGAGRFLLDEGLVQQS